MDDDMKQRLRNRYMDTKKMVPVEICHEAADRIEQLEKERDELLDAAIRQFYADDKLINMPFDCTEHEREAALNEHTSSHYALRSLIVKLKDQS